MANQLKIIIDALWKGKGDARAARNELKGLGEATHAADIRMAAAGQRSTLLSNKMGELGRAVAQGKMTVAEASDEYSRFEGSLADVGQGAEQSGVSMRSLATGIGAVTAVAGTAYLAAKELYDQIGRGAELELAESRLEGLAGSIGTTADALLGKFAQATGNMLSNAEMVASASQIISTGLADNEKDVVRLATVVSELGLDMGQVILTFANNSKMRLDSLGLSVTDVDARTKELVATGMTMDQAFDTAVLELLEKRVETVGSAAGSTRGQVLRLESAWADLRDEVSKSIAEEADLEELTEDVRALTAAVTGAIGPTADFIRWLDRIGKWTPSGAIVEFGRWFIGNIDEWNRALTESDAERRLRLTAQEAATADDNMLRYSETLVKAAAATEQFTTSTEEVWNAEARGRRETRAYAETMAFYAGQTEASTTSTADTAEELIRSRHAAEDTGRALLSASEHVFLWSEAGREAIETGEYWMKSNARMQDQLGGAFVKSLGMAEDEATNFIQVMLDQAAASGANTDALAILASATGNYTDEQIEAAINTAAMTEKAKQLGQAVADGRISAEDALEAFRNFQDQLNQPYEVEVKDNADEAERRLERVKRVADDVAGDRYIRFHIQTIGGIPQTSGPGSSGIPIGAGNEPEYAMGTDGIQRVPGPTGRPFPVILHGGEDFWVGQRGQQAPGGGGDIYQYNTSIVLDGRQSDLPGKDKAEPFLRAARSVGMPV